MDGPQLDHGAVQRLGDLLPQAVLVLDADLRIVEAEGEALVRAGWDPPSLPGLLLDEAFPRQVTVRLERHLRTALGGTAVAFAYDSPVGGGHYAVRARPVLGADGLVEGAVAVFTDESEVEGLQTQLAQARRLLSFGSAVYQRRTGWVADEALRELWGRELDQDPETLIAEAVLVEERAATLDAWRRFCTSGGRLDLHFRLARPARTGPGGHRHAHAHLAGQEVRHVHLVGEGSCDEHGLLRAVTTQVDTTDALHAQHRAEHEHVRAMRTRQLMLERVGDLLAVGLAGGMAARDRVLQAAVDLAAAAVGEGCVLQLVDEHGTGAELSLVAHRDPEAAEQLLARVGGLPPQTARMPAAVQRVLGEARLHLGGDPFTPPGGSAPQASRWLLVPAREGGSALGWLGLTRPAAAPPFAADDVGVAQLLADRIATAVAASRAQARSEAQAALRTRLAQRLAAVSADQGELIVQLDRTEARERARLADVVHDGPLQLVVAAILRLDAVQEALPEAEGAVLEAVATSLQESVGQLRTLVDALAPSDREGGLGRAVAALARAVLVGTDVRVQVTVPERVALDAAREETVLRILREALVNVRKHARASEVRVRAVERADALVLVCADDGVGFEESAVPAGHHGLASMRARAAAADGRLRVHTAPGRGTRLVLVLPRGERGPGPADPPPSGQDASRGADPPPPDCAQSSDPERP